jgi:hypothetical protein
MNSVYIAPSRAAILSAMQAAAKLGTDPYNSHAAQARIFERLWLLQQARNVAAALREPRYARD